MNFGKISFFKNKFLVSLIISAFILLCVYFSSAPFSDNPGFVSTMIREADLGIRNIFLNQFPTNPRPNENITIVTIDNKTLSDKDGLGRFQNFKRAYYAKVIENLKRDGAVVIGLDVLFSEKSEEDDSLANAMKNAGNVILGFSLTENLFPIPPLSSRSLALGYFHPKINPYNSTVYSIIPAKYDKAKKIWESFSFVIARKYFDIISGKNSMSGVESDFHGMRYYMISGIPVPYAGNWTDTGNEVLINYIPKDSKFQTISFLDVYNGNYNPGLVKDKIILIGSTATALHDEFSTPYGIQSGVLVHANMLNTIFNKSFIVEVDQMTEIFLLAFLTIFLCLFTMHVDNRIYQLAFSGIAFVLFLSAEIFYFTTFHRLFQYPVELFLIIILIALIVTGYKYIYEEKGKRLLKNTLSQYLAEDLVLNVLNNYEEVRLGGTRREITTFFSDIAGFTSLSENMEPEELVQFLSIYLKEVSDIIMQEKGFINKYEGDAVMAIWGAFGEEKNQAVLACRSALAQQKKIEELNMRFKQNYGFEISVRMGINKGPAVVGNIGSQGKKIEYTALGDSVNTASRFEGINKVYSTLICVGESVMEEAKHEFVFRKLDKIQVKGKEKPVIIYELVGTKGEVDEEKIMLVSRFEEALSLYLEHRFTEAGKIFEILWNTQSDGPSHTFMKRLESLRNAPVGADWSGIFRATEK